VLTVVLYLAESRVDPDFSFWDAFIWPYEKYLGDPGKVVDDPLISPIGKLIGTLVGILGVAIFAVPAGLIGSGLTDAMDEEKREKELDEYRVRMRKSFRRTVDKTLRGYLNTLPDGGGEKLKVLNFVPQRIPLSRIQIRQGIEMKDIFDICQKYPEFRLKNLAEAISDEEHPQDSFVVEHFPKNRPYGYAINRKSKVTIVSTSSFAENGTGWFTYYLAKLGGFNYVSKDIEVDPDELDSFYNMSEKPLYEKRPRSEYDVKKDKKAIEILDQKDTNRKAFLKDLREMATGEDSWVILFTAHIKSSMNTVDFHFADAKKDGSDSTVRQQAAYQELLRQLDDMLQTDYALNSDLHSQRYPLTQNNLGYRLRKEDIVCNSFVIWPSCDIINFDNRRLLIAYRMASIISQQLDGGRGIQPDAIKDFKKTGFGYGKIEDGTTETTL
jgi:voltage-gated potassium channel